MIRILPALLLALWTAAAAAADPPLRVGARNFTEQAIVGELYAGALEAAGIPVERRLGLGGALVVQKALEAGEIDIYPEYTGTALNTIVKAAPAGDADAVYAQVKAWYEAHLDATWLKPSGVDDGYAMLVTRETASRDGLRTLSDLARVAGSKTLGLGSEFVDRYDGLPGLKAVYGIVFKATRLFAALPLRYQALQRGQVDVINGFQTDWQADDAAFVALADDRHLFPPYVLCPVIRKAALARVPKAADILDRLDARLDTASMRALIGQVERDHREPRAVAHDFLVAQGLAR